jgi:hypothetical protein
VEIKRSGSQPSGKGPAAYFTGTVRIDPLNSLKSRLKRGLGGRDALWATPEISFPVAPAAAGYPLGAAAGATG